MSKVPLYMVAPTAVPNLANAHIFGWNKLEDVDVLSYDQVPLHLESKRL